MSAAARFSNKVAVVTGGTAGIGLAIAKRLALDGAKVMLSSRKQENVDAAVASINAAGGPGEAAGCVCHVAKAQDRKAMLQNTIDRFGRLDILVNNAGINPVYGDLMEVSERAWDKLFDTNVKAGFELTKLAVPHLEKDGGGSVVFVSSITGYVPFPVISAYGVTKTALLGLTKALAVSLAARDIRVNCIAPGIIKTEFSRAFELFVAGLATALQCSSCPISAEYFKRCKLWDNAGESDIQSLIPLSRFGTPDDCAGSVAFLCSDDAAYITGECIMMSGGMSARL